MSADIDRKLKDLMGRVAEMAPEAPPFPEESVTVTPIRPRRGLSPALVFAGAALLVLAVALPLLLMRGEGVDPVATVPVPVPTTAPETPASTAIPRMEVTVPVVVYLTQFPENSFTENPALVPARGLGSMPEGEPEILAALRTLVDPNLDPPPGLESSIPDGVEVRDVALDGDTVVVDMNQAFLDGAGGLLGDFTMLNQLIWTATQANPEAGVRFTVNGAEPGPFGGDGLMLDTVFTRDYFREDHLNSVLVTTPIGPESTELAGVARVFEATVAYEIRNAAGEVVEADFTQVTCGGCWGSYTIDLDPALLEPGGEVRVFWHSPEDGEPTDVVAIPIPDDEEALWELIP